MHVYVTKKQKYIVFASVRIGSHPKISTEQLRDFKVQKKSIFCLAASHLVGTYNNHC